MNANSEPRDFDIQEPQNEETFDNTCETVDDWEPIRAELLAFPSDQTSFDAALSGDVEAGHEYRGFWLLTTTGSLAVPIQKILDYYFYPTKK